MRKINQDITVILTLYKTPKTKLINLTQYKNFKNNFVKTLNAACMLCDVKKLKSIGFFDEDFFLYWEDIFLMNKINKSRYKMIQANNIEAKHDGGKSTKNTLKIQFIRDSNFKYGELLYDYKLMKLRPLKITRQFTQNIIFLVINSLVFKKKNVLKNLAVNTGILKFLRFYFYKKISSLLNL